MKSHFLRSLAIAGIIAAITLAVAVKPVQAQQTVFNNLGPTQNDYMNEIFPTYSTESQAFEFTVTGGDYTLDSLTLPIYNKSGNDLPFVLQLDADSNGAPGKVQETFAAIVKDGTTYSNTVFDDATNYELKDGDSYFVTLFDPAYTNTNETNAGWILTNSTTDGTTLESYDEGLTYTGSFPGDPVGLVVTGTLIPNTTPTPESGSAASFGVLLAAGAAALMVRHRRASAKSA